jgi:hypothetical protein
MQNELAVINDTLVPMLCVGTDFFDALRLFPF